MFRANNKKETPSKNPMEIIKTLVREGRLDDATAQFLKSLAEESVIIRNAGRTMLEAYRTILDAIANIRGNLNIVLDNVEEVQNQAEDC